MGVAYGVLKTNIWGEQLIGQSSETVVVACIGSIGYLIWHSGLPRPYYRIVLVTIPNSKLVNIGAELSTLTSK